MERKKYLLIICGRNELQAMCSPLSYTDSPKTPPSSGLSVLSRHEGFNYEITEKFMIRYEGVR